jgi:hypothetical protein
MIARPILGDAMELPFSSKASTSVPHSDVPQTVTSISPVSRCHPAPCAMCPRAGRPWPSPPAQRQRDACKGRFHGSVSSQRSWRHGCRDVGSVKHDVAGGPNCAKAGRLRLAPRPAMRQTAADKSRPDNPDRCAHDPLPRHRPQGRPGRAPAARRDGQGDRVQRGSGGAGRAFQDAGCAWLHLVDLNGAFAGSR